MRSGSEATAGPAECNTETTTTSSLTPEAPDQTGHAEISPSSTCSASASSTSTSACTTTSSCVTPSPSQETAFSGMKIATHDELQTMSRAKCPKCGHMRKYFCCECYINFCRIPDFRLPVDVDIIHYPTELLTKSTAVHAKLLAPTQVSIIDYPNVPDYSLSDHLLLYPSKTSVSLNELSLEDLRQVRKLVVIDSQWHKANAVLRHPNLQKLRCVKIVTSKTLFWRYQQHGDEFLATIEAIYQFMREHFEASQSSPYAGAYDNLLFYYSFFYNLIQTAYKSNPASKFTRKQNYIKY